MDRIVPRQILRTALAVEISSGAVSIRTAMPAQGIVKISKSSQEPFESKMLIM